MRKILFSIVAFAVMLGVMQGVSFANSPSASAIAPSCAAAGVACLDVPISVGAPPGNTGGGLNPGGGGGSSGGGSGGGGGTVGPPSSTAYVYKSCSSFPIGNCFNPTGGSLFWAGSARYGDNFPGAYAYWTCEGPVGKPWFGVTYIYKSGVFSSYICHFGAESVNRNTILETRTCYVSYDAALYQSQNKSTIRSGGSIVGGAASPNPRNNQPNSIHSANITLANFNLCGGLDANPVFGLNRPDQGGNAYYRASIQTYSKVCSKIGFQRYLGDTSADRIQCGATSPAGNYSTYAVNACNYNYVKVGANHGALPNNVNFAVSACSNFQCSAVGTKIGGTDQPVQVMRNGANVSVLFANLNVNHDAGVRNITNIQRNTTVVGGSSPFNGTDANAGNQYFQLQNEKGSRLKFGQWESGSNVNRNLVFYWASDQGKNFKLTSNYKFDGEFYVYAAGNTNGGGGYVWAKDTINCANSVSNPVTVTRSVNR